MQSEVPADVMEAARKCAGEWNLIDAIAKAILAERARCESALSTDAEPVAWQWRARVKGGVWDAWEDGRYGNSDAVPPSIEIEERGLYPAPPAPAVAEEIADAVLSWMVKYDLLDAGNEYRALDVLAVLDDFKPSQHSAPAVAAKALDARALAIDIVDGVKGYTLEFAQDQQAHKIDWDNAERKINAALSAQVQDVAGDLEKERDREEKEYLKDKIEGLQSDLDSAVEVAFKRGATDWVRLNYPAHYFRFTAAPAAKQGEGK